MLDHDSEHIETLRAFGFKVYFGDASRLDLLESAGAEHAKILVVAVDDKDTINDIISLAKKHFPHLHIIARAKDVYHFYELKKMGVEIPERELFESSLMLGRQVLEKLGFGRFEAKEMTDSFRVSNYKQLTYLQKVREKHQGKQLQKLVS